MGPTRRQRTRATLPITPPAMSPVASDMSLDSSEGGQSSGGRRYHCPIDQYLTTVNPNHKPAQEDVLLKTVLFRASRVTSDVEEAWKLYVKRANEVVGQLKSQPPVADKPKDGDESVMYYDIPDSEDLAIRLWDGNMQQYGLYCFDLYDKSKCIAVNLRDGYKICNAPHAGTLVVGGTGSEVKSWEMAWGIRPEEISPGQERFAVPEGSHLALVRRGRQPFFFALPTRPRAYGGVAAIFARPRY